MSSASAVNTEPMEISKTTAEKNYVRLKVVAQDGTEVLFRVRTTARLEKVKKAFAERTGNPNASLRFIFDGRRLTDSDTPAELEMTDEDLIEVYTEQIGGRSTMDVTVIDNWLQITNNVGKQSLINNFINTNKI